MKWSATGNGRLCLATNAEKSTSECVTLSGAVALKSEAIFGVVLLLLAFATCMDPLECLVMSFFPYVCYYPFHETNIIFFETFL